MRTYLSIDIDYWRKFPGRVQEDLRRTLRCARARNVPIVAVMNHQQMLKEVNESDARRLINIDAHSDLADSEVDELNCGTWVSYVRWRRSAEYIWLRSNTGWGGSCNWGMHSRRATAKGWSMGSDWKKVSTECQGTSLEVSTLMKGCVGVGICMSPSWCTMSGEIVFQNLVDEFEIPYRKGTREEDNVRRKNVKPPFRKAA